MWQGACCVVAHGVRKNITSDIVSTKYLSIARTSFLHPRATRPEIGEGRSFEAQLRLPPRGYVRGCRWRQEVTEEHLLSRFYIIGTTSVVPKKKAGSQLGAKNIAISAYEELVRTVKRSEADKLTAFRSNTSRWRKIGAFPRTTFYSTARTNTSCERISDAVPRVLQKKIEQERNPPDNLHRTPSQVGGRGD